MALDPGTRLGPYEVLAPLGAGGMGEVYKARDTRLDRIVALKILPAEFSEDAARRGRFAREAKTISQLNHPHICVLHDVGEAKLPSGQPASLSARGASPPLAGALRLEDSRVARAAGAVPSPVSVSYLVMEFLEGQTLAQRLSKGRLPLDETLRIGAEIADALAAAHRHGVIHRDLKPSNIMLARGGSSGPPTVKLLDFGLAKTTEPIAAADPRSGADTDSLTGDGRVVGTRPYMAPEQLEGRPADVRTDIWALGCVLYEMVTGRRAFHGDSHASLAAAIMRVDPPALATRQPRTPPSLDRLVRRSLAKRSDDRWDSAHDIAGELRWIAQGGGVAEGVGMTGAISASPRSRRSVLLALVVGLALGGFVAGVLAWALRPARIPSAPRVIRAVVGVQPAEELHAYSLESREGRPITIRMFDRTPGGSRQAIAWTPDGRALVFVGRQGGAQQLYVRPVDAGQARPLAGTTDAQLPTLSPDGRHVAFWAHGAIRTAPVLGGPASVLVEPVKEAPRGIDWGTSGVLYEQGARIWLSTSGNEPRSVTSPQAGELSHVLPHWLSGDAFAYTVRARDWTWGDERVVVQRLSSDERRVLVRNAADARYVSTGHLVFLRLGTLHAVAFDAPALETRGEPAALVSGIAQAVTETVRAHRSGAGQYSVAATGDLAYLPGEILPYPDARLVTVDRRGRVTLLEAPVRAYDWMVRVAPDGRRVAVVIQSLTEQALWLFDLSRHGLTRVTTGGEASWPVWTREGERLAFYWVHDGEPQLAWQQADGGNGLEKLAGGVIFPASWTTDNQLIAVRDERDVIRVDDGTGGPRVSAVMETPATDGWPAISPDGRWLALASDTSGHREVYIQPYPGPGPRIQVSIDGGYSPAWHPAGRELFFLTHPDDKGRQSMMAVSFDLKPELRLEVPHALFSFDADDLAFGCRPAACFDVAPDGERFFVTQRLRSSETAPVTQIEVVLNWTEELKAKVGGG